MIGKDLFGKTAVELCLVPNVKIQVKFKVHDFEKYIGNSCSLSHLVTYARKMSTQIDNDQLLIHYFQDSLTGVALRWHMGLDSARIRTFNDLGEAFIKQYKYNVDMAPDRDQFRTSSIFGSQEPTPTEKPITNSKTTSMMRSLVVMHKDIGMVSDCEHDHDGCAICSVNPRGCVVVKRYIQRMMDEGMIQIAQSRHVDDDVNFIVPVFKNMERVVIQYDNSNNNNNSQRSVSPLVIWLVGLVSYSSYKVVPYQYNATMLKDGQEVPLPTTSSVVSIVDVTKVEVPAIDSVSAPKCQSGETSNLKVNDDAEFDHIVANITSYNNLSFCDDELPKEGKNHNLALHISMNSKDDALSNVLVDTGSSLNVMPKSSLSNRSYQRAPIRYNGVIVKSFDGSRKTVIGEVDLLVKIGPTDFHITFQVMDIHLAYRCPLGRPWIHEAGAVTSVLHQKLKFVKTGKLVIISGEKALLGSHLSSFSYVEAEDEVGTPFQTLSIIAEKRVGAPMSSLKDARKIVEEGNIDQWGHMVEVSDNKGRTGVGFQQGLSTARSEDMQLNFHSGEDIHGNEQHLVALLEVNKGDDFTNFVTHGKACNNWNDVDIPIILHRSKIKEKSIYPFEEQIELVNLGFEDDLKEVKIGSRLYPDAKKGLVDLLREYSDVFAWSYQDMPSLDSEIVEHILPLKPKYPPVKQKLRRTHHDMAVKIKEEVQKQIDVGFLITAEYP
ncbi:hypothetical protein KIW84_022132 [Lathyrus oleraceus]|uniref:Polyprotein n=1 Tax=Pisum sativum TaxID=3888 RepID=A0A9D5B9K0_PEA|nr:hypothetical protein KIW84_022132 [Pisum sativum]